MNRAFRFVVAVVMSAMTVAMASAYDFGLTLDNKTAGNFDTSLSGFGLTQEDTLSAWFSAPLGPNVNFYSQGSYQFTLSRYYLFDVDQLYVDLADSTTADSQKKVTMRVGRFFDNDVTGHVLNGRLDGFRIDYAYPKLDLTMTLGYTGLMLKPTSTIVMSQMDNQDLGNSSVVLGPPRLIGQTVLRFPNLIGFQTLSLDFIVQMDLRSSSSVVPVGQTTQVGNSGGLLDTQYTGLKINGPITPRLFYTAFSYVNTGTTLSYVPDSSSGTGFSYQYEPIIAYAGGGSIDIYPTFLKSHFGISGVYSTGDSDATSYIEGNTNGLSTSFIPINQDTTYALLFTPQLGNLARVGATASIKPFSTSQSEFLSTFQTEVKAFAYLRPAASQPIAAPGVLTGVGGPYLGTEVDLYLRSRPFSDLGLALFGGAFFPHSGTGQPFAAGEPIGFQVGLNAVMSF